MIIKEIRTLLKTMVKPLAPFVSYPLRNTVSLAIVIPVLFCLYSHDADAAVLIPQEGYAGYFDHNGTYTVYGFVRNTGGQPVIARAQVQVDSGGHAFTESRILPIIFPLKDMPFNFKFREVTSGNPVLQRPEVSFIDTNSRHLGIAIIYGKTLKIFPDGHLTGLVINMGISTARNIEIYALVHDRQNKYLGEVESLWPIPSLGPGMKADFSMYPDPSIAKKVYYYSCFVPGADNVIEMSATKDGKRFYFSVLSIVYFTNQKFGQNGTTLSFEASNAWHLPYYANFMFPASSSKGGFEVLVDGKKTDALVSKDVDTKNWHVAFNVPYGQHRVTISGFYQKYVPESNQYFYLDAKSALTDWGGFATFTISDSTLLKVLGIQGHFIPSWVKNSVRFMMYDNVPPGSIVHELKYLKHAGIIR